jgi:hypothetical protein
MDEDPQFPFMFSVQFWLRTKDLEKISTINLRKINISKSYIEFEKRKESHTHTWLEENSAFFILSILRTIHSIVTFYISYSANFVFWFEISFNTYMYQSIIQKKYTHTQSKKNNQNSISAFNKQSCL